MSGGSDDGGRRDAISGDGRTAGPDADVGEVTGAAATARDDEEDEAEAEEAEVSADLVIAAGAASAAGAAGVLWFMDDSAVMTLRVAEDALNGLRTAPAPPPPPLAAAGAARLSGGESMLFCFNSKDRRSDAAPPALTLALALPLALCIAERDAVSSEEARARPLDGAV